MLTAGQTLSIFMAFAKRQDIKPAPKMVKEVTYSVTVSQNVQDEQSVTLIKAEPDLNRAIQFACDLFRVVCCDVWVHSETLHVSVAYDGSRDIKDVVREVVCQLNHDCGYHESDRRG